MESSLRNEARARQFLLDSESIRRNLFAVAGGTTEKGTVVRALRDVESIGVDLGIPADDLHRVQAVRNLVAHGSRPSPEQLAEAEGLVERIKEILARYLSTREVFEGPVPREDRNRFFDAARIIDAELGTRASRNRIAHVKVVEKAIFDSPGHFIYDLYERLNDPAPHPGFSYTSVWLYIQHLVRTRRVLTVGGVKGVNRYCFPHPNALRDWKQYYGGPFLIEARLDRNLTDWFDFTHSHKLVDVFTANSILKRDILVIAEMGRLGRAEGTVIHSLGTLQPFSQVSSSLGLRTKRTLPAKDALLAGLVDRITSEGKEERLWASPEAAAILS